MTKQTPFPTIWEEGKSEESQAIPDMIKSSTFHILRGKSEKSGSCWVEVLSYFGRKETRLWSKVSLDNNQVLVLSCLSSPLVPERLTARRSSCPVCLLCRDDWFFLIQAIDASVLTDLYWLGMV